MSRSEQRPPISADELMLMLEQLDHSRFDEATTSLREIVHARGARISRSSQPIAAAELIEIYELRREHCRSINLVILGLEPLIDVLNEASASWTMVSFTGGGRWGLVFLMNGVEPRACLVGVDADASVAAGPDGL